MNIGGHAWRDIAWSLELTGAGASATVGTGAGPLAIGGIAGAPIGWAVEDVHNSELEAAARQRFTNIE